jgi:hypothetical protein
MIPSGDWAPEAETRLHDNAVPSLSDGSEPHSFEAFDQGVELFMELLHKYATKGPQYQRPLYNPSVAMSSISSNELFGELVPRRWV